MNKIVKVWMKDYGRWWVSGKGRDSWSSLGKAKAADLVEVSREVWPLS